MNCTCNTAMLKPLTQKDIDNIATILGIISGVAGILTTSHVIDSQMGTLVSQLCNLAIAFLVGKIGIDLNRRIRP